MHHPKSGIERKIKYAIMSKIEYICHMKNYFVLVFIFGVCNSFFAQTWQSAYDSCKKYQEKKNYKTALEWSDRTLALYEKQTTTKDTNYSRILKIQIENLYYNTQYDKAIDYAQKDSVFAINNYDKKNKKYTEACHSLATLYYLKGQYILAENMYKTNIATLETNNDTKNAEYDKYCNNLANLYEQKARYVEAESLYKKLQQLRMELYGKNSLEYSRTSNSLGVLYMITERYTEAENALKEAEKILVQTSNTETTYYADVCNNIALMYDKQGRSSDAEPLLRKARNIYFQLFGKNNPNYAIFTSNIGALYYSLGYYDYAEQLFLEAMDIQSSVLGKQHLSYINTCNNLAGVYENQKRYAEAESLHLNVKKVRESLFGKSHPYYANSCNNLGELYRKQGRFNEAETLYKTAISLRLKLFGRESADYANSCNNLGGMYHYKGDLQQAEKYYTEALEVQKKVFLNSSRTIMFKKNIAVLYASQGDYKKADQMYSEVIPAKLKEIQQNFKGLSEVEKEKYIKTKVDTYFDSFFNFAATYYTQKPNISIDVYNSVLVIKGLILNSVQKVKNRIFNSKDPILKKLYTEWKKTKDLYTKQQAKKLNYDSLEKRANELEKELSSRSELFANLVDSKPVTWKDIKNYLKKDEAAVEMVRIDSKDFKYGAKDSIMYIALIVKSNSEYPEIVVLQNGNDLESKFITNYRRSITTKTPEKESYDIFWKPILEKLKGIKTVYFSPDGVYHQINLSTLQNPQNQKYIFDEVRIINVTSTKDILTKTNNITKNSYFIGNPKFSFEKDIKNNEKPLQQRSLENLSQLEGAEKEVKLSAGFIKNAIAVTGEEATEEYVKNLKNPRILHVATHGYFKKGMYQSSIQAMLNAGLLFAGAVDMDKMDIRPFDKEDGKLTAFEVMNMELDSTELVVLSACETGLGQATKEGVYGLQRAFKVAGVQTIIMSLWKVNDEATQLLMTEFYENWQKKRMDKRKAFETAQKDLRKQYKEPYYWGAFVMIE